MFTKLARGSVGIIAGIFFIAYVCLLFPALVYMPILGLLAAGNGGGTCGNQKGPYPTALRQARSMALPRALFDHS